MKKTDLMATLCILGDLGEPGQRGEKSIGGDGGADMCDRHMCDLRRSVRRRGFQVAQMYLW